MDTKDDSIDTPLPDGLLQASLASEVPNIGQDALPDPTVATLRRKRSDVLERYRSATTTTETAISEMRGLHSAHLQVAKGALRASVNRETSAQNLILFHGILEDYLRDLATIVRGGDTRLQVLRSLRSEVTPLVTQVVESDLPLSIKNTVLDAIASDCECIFTVIAK